MIPPRLHLIFNEDGLCYAGLRCPMLSNITVKWHAVDDESRDVMLIHEKNLKDTIETIRQFSPASRVNVEQIILPTVANHEFNQLNDDLQKLFDAGNESACNLAAHFDNNPDLAVELFETGSVTLKPVALPGREFVVSLLIHEVPHAK